jgi:hypothetical protein
MKSQSLHPYFGVDCGVVLVRGFAWSKFFGGDKIKKATK